ncbi:MAG: hypothetical protein HND53_12155 [Proteobacteria bacterium]|nr:hypothetical protein [Pseudomonadota bacterium]NOG61247.1 hypothetical protein [Pseudomonadota bacterium]
MNDTAAYVVLGVLGAALLTHIFTNNNSQYSNTYPKSHSTILRKKNKHTVAIKHNKPVKRAIYHYNKKEGWKQLANGNANYALDIFAVQSQQNLISGEPKIGFALAAAIMGDKERAIRTMKKAIRIDANALNHIDTHTIKTTIERLSANYQSVMHDKLVDTDTTFMTATLAYLQNDYATVKTLITKNNQSQSAINLRELVKNKL